jgi:hypothetical protein
MAAVRGAIVAALLAAGVANAQQEPSRESLSRSQQSPHRSVLPIVGGWRLQPHRSELQELGVPAPSRQQIQEMDRLMRQLLDDSRNGSGHGNP